MPSEKKYLDVLAFFTLVVSLLGVGVSFYAAIEASDASLAANRTSIEVTKITWSLEKSNEIETRIYEQRYELYKSVAAAFTRFNWDTTNSYLQKAKILRNELVKIGYEVRIIGTPYIICRYSDLLSGIDGYIEFVEKESSTHAYTDYWRDVIPWLFLFEKSIRDTVLQAESVEFTLIPSTDGSRILDEWAGSLISSCAPWSDFAISEEQYR